MFIQIVGTLIFALAWMVAFAGIASAMRPIARQLRKAFASGTQEVAKVPVRAPALQVFAAHVVSPRPTRKNMGRVHTVQDQDIRLVA